MNALVAHSRDHLLQLLAATDISVPPRALGRTKEHTQRWAIARFLATFANVDLVRFPLQLTDGERPDFVLARAGDEAGVETTEATHPDHARIDALRNIRGYVEPRLYLRLRPDEPSMPLVKIDAIARGALTSSAGWAGESVELDWAEAMDYVIRRKVERFEQQGFRKFPENWLLIYDNWELPFLDRDKAAKKLSASLNAHTRAIPFDRVFIETGNAIFEYYGVDHTRWPLNDLWQITTLDG